MCADYNNFEVSATRQRRCSVYFEDKGEPLLRSPRISDKRVLSIGWSVSSECRCLFDENLLVLENHSPYSWPNGCGYTDSSLIEAAKSAAVLLSDFPIRNFTFKGGTIGSIKSGFYGGDGPDDWVSEISVTTDNCFSYLQYALDSLKSQVRLQLLSMPLGLSALLHMIKNHVSKASYDRFEGRYSGIAQQGFVKALDDYTRQYLADNLELPQGEHVVRDRKVSFPGNKALSPMV